MSPNLIWLVSWKGKKFGAQHRHGGGGGREPRGWRQRPVMLCNSVSSMDCQPAARSPEGGLGRVSSIPRKHQMWQGLDFRCSISRSVRLLLWFSTTLFVLCNKSLSICLHMDSLPRKNPLSCFSSRDFNICYNSEPNSKHFTSIISCIFHKNTMKKELEIVLLCRWGNLGTEGIQ